jgi:hypothetical protein
LQTDKRPLGITKIADDSPKRLRQFPHKRWNGQDLIAGSQLRMLHEVDDFNTVPAG